MIWFIVFFGGFFALFALFGLLVWIWSTGVYFVQASRSLLVTRTLIKQIPFAVSVTGMVLLAFGFLFPALVLSPSPFPGWMTNPLVLGLWAQLLVCLLLWALTLLLFAFPKVPDYRYLLPRDADLVRWFECQQGIVLAAQNYPRMLDVETLELISISSTVLWRQKNFPKRRRWREQLTNEFAPYTNLAVEGFSTGYRSFIQACHNDPGKLESLRKAIVDDWPEEREVYSRVEELASLYLHQAK